MLTACRRATNPASWHTNTIPDASVIAESSIHKRSPNIQSPSTNTKNSPCPALLISTPFSAANKPRLSQTSASYTVTFQFRRSTMNSMNPEGNHMWQCVVIDVDAGFDIRPLSDDLARHLFHYATRGPQRLHLGLRSSFQVPTVLHEEFARYLYRKGLADEEKVLEFIRGRDLCHLQRVRMKVTLTCICVSVIQLFRVQNELTEA
ncbi:hypothetical protein SISNIDRAFT_447566 [Sistotremastrum niveocremeum HHB9708]|uniref:Uncharacterized protein n=1 Tax=Sistotremastrum niveocremeum HHB9708 TaxID=1314777 RepID=A0A165AC39_9AGAM|nr:hypothetical protein SISNIDRAFT_447566 [Sistotremastrum niveocremeum HHB9708]